MMTRMLPPCLVALALALFLGVPALADDKDKDQGETHLGKIIRVQGEKLIMVDREGKNEHTHMLTRTVKFRLDNKEIQFADVATELKPGMLVRVTTAKGDKTKVLKVEALTKGDYKDFKEEEK